MEQVNLYVGCGPDYREGFIHSDVRPFPHVDIICSAWEISKHISDVDHIYSRHMLEHLTEKEAHLTLRDWFAALKAGGTIRLVVPNMNYHCEQWLKAEWNSHTATDKTSDAVHSSAGFWGWQAECDPEAEDYNKSYWDVHKSGYNERKARFLFSDIGFDNIVTEIKNCAHLVVEAQKLPDLI